MSVSPLKKRYGNWCRNASRNRLWGRYWGRAGQLMASCFLTLSLPSVAKGKFRPNFQISFSKIVASSESTGKELSFEWSHHRISSTDSKVRVTLQNSIKHSGSERVKWGITKQILETARCPGQKILQQAKLHLTFS